MMRKEIASRDRDWHGVPAHSTGATVRPSGRPDDDGPENDGPESDGEAVMDALMFKRTIGMAMLMALAACAPPPAPPPPPPRIVVAPPPPPPMPMPVPPNSAAPNLIIPITDVTGRRMTPNVDLSPEQALWQLRIALNVAALNCRGPDEAILVANYSRFLTTNRAAISRAERAVIADLGRRTGTNGISTRDSLSTRLYNYFAQPPVIEAFCAKATSVTALAAMEPTASILPFSVVQLSEVDRPFVDFYAAYDRYRADYATWRTLNPLPVAPMTPAVVAPSVVAPATTTTVAPSVAPGGQ